MVSFIQTGTYTSNNNSIQEVQHSHELSDNLNILTTGIVGISHPISKEKNGHMLNSIQIAKQNDSLNAKKDAQNMRSINDRQTMR